MSDAILTKIDEMGGRIDELERNITDLCGHGTRASHAPRPAPALIHSPPSLPSAPQDGDGARGGRGGRRCGRRGRRRRRERGRAVRAAGRARR